MSAPRTVATGSPLPVDLCRRLAVIYRTNVVPLSSTREAESSEAPADKREGSRFGRRDGCPYIDREVAFLVAPLALNASSVSSSFLPGRIIRLRAS